MEKIAVDLGENSYVIHIGRDLLKDAHFFPEAHHRSVVIITNNSIAPFYADLLKQTLIEAGSKPALLVLPDGEKYKTLDTFNDILSFLLEHHYGRDTLLIALGGGVIGDLVGFAAASFQRGVDFIQVPTTLLAQVDSSVGGKTAVNHPLGKNMIGAFYQPKSVLIDLNVLSSLSEREFISGLAEVIKYGIIYDESFFKWLEENAERLQQRDSDALTYVIKRCCEIKAAIVARDEKEANMRMLLNLGHTFGHAIETHMGYGNWLHGEAVAVGMMLAAKTAHLMNIASLETLNRVEALIQKYQLPTETPEQMHYADFISHMKRDKKVSAGTLRFILPTTIGSAQVFSTVTPEILKQAIGS